MSLINNVLKELESKPSSFEPLEMAMPMPASEAASIAGRQYLWLLLMIVLLALVFVFREQLLAVTEMPRQSATEQLQAAPATLPESVSVAPQAVAVAPIANPALLERNRITGLQINENRDSMELLFEFSQPAQSYLRKRSPGLYLFHIDGVEQGVAAPELSDNPWLRNIQLTSGDGGVDIAFHTREGVFVETSQSDGVSGFRWLIRLHRPVVAEAETPAGREVKSRPTATVAAAPRLSAVSQPIVAPASESKRPDTAPVKLNIRPVSEGLTEAQRLQRALALLRSGQARAAEPMLRALKGGRLDRDARLNLASMLQAGKRPRELDLEIQEALKLYPRDEDFGLLHAARLFETGQHQRLVEAYAATSGNVRILNLLGASYQRLEIHDKAAAAFTRALAISPDQPRLWVSLAISQQHQQQSAAALQSYRMALRTGLKDDALVAFVNGRIAVLSRR
jgi:Tfp pilus assembly protein PilF